MILFWPIFSILYILFHHLSPTCCSVNCSTFSRGNSMPAAAAVASTTYAKRIHGQYCMPATSALLLSQNGLTSNLRASKFPGGACPKSPLVLHSYIQILATGLQLIDYLLLFVTWSQRNEGTQLTDWDRCRCRSWQRCSTLFTIILCNKRQMANNYLVYLYIMHHNRL